MDLIIVESPTKARTLTKFLGEKYHVEASMGHIRDLPSNKIAIDTKANFEPEYVQTAKQKEVLKKLKTACATADKIYLATDPDREGEAIAWHIAELLADNKKQTTKNKQQKIFQRVTFHEITKSAIDHALEDPGVIDMALVNAQQARRIVDRLVGYKLSPLLWRKVRRGLSAGRVQSIAVRLVVEREKEINAFVVEEYWEIEVGLQNSKGQKFTAHLIQDLNTQIEAEKLKEALEQSTYIVESCDQKTFSRNPSAPFTTSTLQQGAASRLGWSAKKTMQVAQRLYEMGFITYHRTDSTNLAIEATAMAKKVIASQFGSEYALPEPRLFKTKSKVAQEAHEAIRPTDSQKHYADLGDASNRDEQRLYELIWKRFMACQTAPVTGINTKVVITADDGKNQLKLQASGQQIQFDGWYKVMGIDAEKQDEEKYVPALKERDVLQHEEVLLLQKFTQPPARYNDASLIKALEELGVGRPSTYAPTLSTIEDRHYVERIDKRLKPTAIASAVHDFLTTNFPEIVDYAFTAHMEDELDAIANGEITWQEVVGEFYMPFSKKLESVQDTAARVKIETENTGQKCPTCHEGDELVRTGKFGKFLSCSRYPDCKYKANYLQKVGVMCPTCGIGDVIMRKSQKGRNFFGCSRYPECKWASWNKPEAKS